MQHVALQRSDLGTKVLWNDLIASGTAQTESLQCSRAAHATMRVPHSTHHQRTSIELVAGYEVAQVMQQRIIFIFSCSIICLR